MKSGNAKIELNQLLNHILDEQQSVIERAIEPLSRKYRTLYNLYHAGARVALLEAWQLAVDSGIKPPKILLEATLTELEDHFRTKYAKRKAVSNGTGAAAKSDAIRFSRWYTVYKLREQNVRWDDVYLRAEIELQNTAARGSADTMNASYKRVQKELQTNAGKALHYWGSVHLRRKIGIPIYLPKFLCPTKGESGSGS